jgi:hypothetical protein
VTKVSKLSSIELRSWLQNTGLNLQTGPFIVNLKTKLAALTEQLRSLYADFIVAQDVGFADFHIQIVRSNGLRAWWRPQVFFYFQGRSPFNPFPLRLSFPLLEWGMNWCIATYAHQYLVIHSAVLERNGWSLMLTAPPGSGKSTLTAALVFRGWRLLSDELALVRPLDGQVVPVPRPISLKNESIEIIRRFAPDASISPAWPDSHKGTVALVRPPQECVDRACETALPAWVLCMSYSADAKTQLKPLPKARAFLRVAESSFNYSLLGTRGFEAMARLIDLCDCYEFSYSNLDDAVRRLSLLTHKP